MIARMTRTMTMRMIQHFTFCHHNLRLRRVARLWNMLAPSLISSVGSNTSKRYVHAYMYIVHDHQSWLVNGYMYMCMCCDTQMHITTKLMYKYAVFYIENCVYTCTYTLIQYMTSVFAWSTFDTCMYKMYIVHVRVVKCLIVFCGSVAITHACMYTLVCLYM